MRLIRLAIRNLGRSRFRTILSIVAVALGVLVVILTKSLIDGMLDSIITSTVRLTAGHIRIIDPEYRKKEQLLSLNYPVGGLQEHEGVSDLVRQLELLSSVRVAAPRIRFVAMASHGEMLEGVMGVAVDPEREELVARLSRFMGEGRLPQPGSREVVLGGELLLDLGMLVGDKVDLVFTTAYGAMRAATFGVVGEFASGLAYLDKATAYIPLDTAQDLLAMGDTATEVVVMAVSERRIAQTLSQVRALLPGTPRCLHGNSLVPTQRVRQLHKDGWRCLRYHLPVHPGPGQFCDRQHHGDGGKRKD